VHCNRPQIFRCSLVKNVQADEIAEAQRPFSAETAADALLAAKRWITEQAQCDELSDFNYSFLMSFWAAS
jgi:hypothetical protein